MIEKLKTLDCTDVATSLAYSARLMTAVWYIVTSGPNARPQRKNPACETPIIPRKTRNIAIEMPPSASMDTTSGRRYASMYFAETTTEMTEPIPKISIASPMPPTKSSRSTSRAM